MFVNKSLKFRVRLMTGRKRTPAYQSSNRSTLGVKVCSNNDKIPGGDAMQERTKSHPELAALLRSGSCTTLCAHPLIASNDVQGFTSGGTPDMQKAPWQTRRIADVVRSRYTMRNKNSNSGIALLRVRTYDH